MAKKVKNMLKNNMVLCVLVLAVIGLASVVFAADFKIKEGKVKEGVVFGSWIATDSNSNTLAKDAIYKASTDGFVVARCYISGGYTAQINAYTDSSSLPNIRRLAITSEEDNNTSHVCITLPVKKDDYWRLTMGTPTDYAIYWIPLGDGSAPVKQ